LSKTVFNLTQQFNQFGFHFYRSLRRKFPEPDDLSLSSSTILVDKSLQDQLLVLCEFDAQEKWKLLYRASEDGFSAECFHMKCDLMPNTLTIVKSTNGNVFGGYTQAAWDSVRTKKDDEYAFVFSLINQDNTPVKIPIAKDQVKSAIYCHPTYGPTFGKGSDFYISSDSNRNPKSYSRLSYSFRHPNYEYGSEESRNFLAGSHRFLTSEVEVYHKEK
jgi:hypothetical protein